MEQFSLLSDNSQFSSASAVYNVGSQCRTIQPVLGELEKHQFLVGTRSIRKSNEVHIIEYSDVDNSISCPTIIDFPDGEINGLFPCPGCKNLFFVVFTNKEFQRNCVLLSTKSCVPAEGERHFSCPAAFSLPDLEGFGPVLFVVWKPIVDTDDAYGLEDGEEASSPDPDGEHTFVAVHANGFQVWDIMVDEDETHLQPREQGRGVVWGTDGESGMGKITAAAWDPHHKNLLLLAVDGDLVTFDIETLVEVRRCHHAHDAPITAIDFNPNKPWAVLSSDYSGRVLFWDIRKASVASAVSAPNGAPSEKVTKPKCAKVIKAHSHWVTASQYNPAHDQLVLTSSSDQAVKLWRVSSISSAPLMELDDSELAISNDSADEGNVSESSTSAFEFPNDRPGATAADILVKKFMEHEDSVYDIAWSASESWVFASVSHGGRVVVSSVPSSEKYKILL